MFASRALEALTRQRQVRAYDRAAQAFYLEAAIARAALVLISTCAV
jgi:hypothetical protein